MMNRILFAIAMISSLRVSFAQSDVENKLKEAMWTTPSAAFKTTEVPEKWKNESAVVLALEREYISDNVIKVKGRYYVEKFNSHIRIKLLDKAAVADYSDLSFNDKSIRNNIFGRATKYRVIGIKIIKPNGSSKEVDLSAAVKADITSDRELKIAIPNLDPGDIVDYYIAVREERAQYQPEFSDEIILEGKYPIVSNTFRFTLPKDIDFVSFPYNGAPKFTSTIAKKEVIYELKSSMQEKAPDLLWDYEYRSSPHVRYRVTSDPVRKDSKVLAQEALDNLNRYPFDIGVLRDFVIFGLKKEKDPVKITREIFYLMRNPIYLKAFFDIELGDPLSAGSTPNKFFFILHRFLNDQGIPNEVLLVPSRSYGPLADVVSFSYCDFLIKVNTKPAFYITRPGPFTLVNEVPYSLEEMEAASTLRVDVRVPATEADKNIESTTLDITFGSDDMTKLRVKRNLIAKGYKKLANQYNVYTNYDYMVAYDLPKYQVEASRLMSGIIKEYNKEKTKFEQRRVQDYHERDERMKTDIERDMHAKVSDYTLALKNIGMWDSAPDLQFEDAFLIENMTKRAGPNMIIELGKFIGNQTEIKQDQLVRTRDVYFDYAGTFTQDITLTIPDGYEVEGLANLNKKVETEAGGFISTANIVGNQLKVTTRKYYTKRQLPSSDWSKLTGFLAAAVEFQQSKILLKKK